MKTWIYKGKKKPNCYLYIDQQDQFDGVPDVLIKMLGELSFVLELELNPERKLAQADVNEVLSQLELKGYFLQMPPGDLVQEKLC